MAFFADLLAQADLALGGSKAPFNPSAWLPKPAIHLTDGRGMMAKVSSSPGYILHHAYRAECRVSTIVLPMRYYRPKPRRLIEAALC